MENYGAYNLQFVGEIIPDSETGTAGKDERCADSNAPVEAGPHGLMDDG
jgi:hypothetical protein